MAQSLTLLCSIVLVGLTLPLPYIAINIVKIVSGRIGNTVELEEVCLSGQSPEQEQKPPNQHREAVKTRLNTAAPLPFITTWSACTEGNPSFLSAMGTASNQGRGALVLALCTVLWVGATT